MALFTDRRMKPWERIVLALAIIFFSWVALSGCAPLESFPEPRRPDTGISPGTNPWTARDREIYRKVWGDWLDAQPRNPRPAPQQIGFMAGGEQYAVCILSPGGK